MFHHSCAFCAQLAAAAVNLGPLLGPICDSKSANADELYAHRLCALWSSEVFETDKGTLRNVLAAIKRGRLMKCAHCGRRGATVGCRVPSCNCSYHVACAGDAGCAYYCEQFQIACPEHACQFRKEAIQQTRQTPFMPFHPALAADPTGELLGHGGRASSGKPGQTPGGGGGKGDGEDLLSPPTELPALVGHKHGRQQEAARQHIMRARTAMKRARRDIERQRRWAAEYSSDDDEHFQKKEKCRLAHDTAKLNPITLNGDGTAMQHLFIKCPAPVGAAHKEGKDPGLAGLGLLDNGRRHPRRPKEQQQQQQQQQPTVETAVVGSIVATDFSSVAGLDDVVRQLREMVLLPMQYPALFEGNGLLPPRGILLHGVPGTGKTLAARALAGACAKHSPLPVTFFARKGADCLGKFHGEAERTLRLLFEEASRRAPAIIFLDELDALVPARAARAGGSDQIYASVVSTLLSLMDGVTDRGSVIVIGATNRPEAIDPALRRSGRFDREVYFGLPTPEQRLAILRVHTQRWGQPPAEQLLQQVASRAEGFAGADLEALCTAAVMAAVRRSMPLLLEQAEQKGAAAGATAVAGAGEGAEAALPARGWQQAGGGEGGAWLQEPQEAAEQRRRRQQLLDGIEVQPGDWREALAVAPPPCSRRAGMAALAAEAAAPLQQHTLPLLVRPLARLLVALDAADLPLPPPAAAAASAVVARSVSGRTGAAGMQRCCGQRAGAAAEEMAEEEQWQLREAALAAALIQHGALLERPGVPAASTGTAASTSVPPAASQRAAAVAAAMDVGGDERRHLEWPGRSYSPCRLLLWGQGEQGQEAASGALLKLLDGCPVHCLSLPSLVVEGGDDVAAGCVALVGEALRRASPHTPCVFYLPRIEAWALSKAHVLAEDAVDASWCCQVPGGGSSVQYQAGQGKEEAAPEWLGQPPSVRSGGGLQSPSCFNAMAPSPLSVSPGHRGFMVTPSPFSGLLPLEERVANMPAVARALHSVAHKHMSGGSGTAGGSGAEEAGRADALERQQRADAAVPGMAAQPPLLPVAGGTVVAPPAGLTLVRTSPDHKQQQQQMLAAGVAAPVPAGAAPAVGELLCRRTDDKGGGSGGEEEGGTEVEVMCLSQAWSVFESLMRQVPASQPVIVLATCHTEAAGTPRNLLQFFAGPAGVPAAAVQQAQGQGKQQELLEGPPDGEPPVSAGGLAAPSIVRMQPPSGTAWHQAAAAAANHVAAAVATQAAVLLHQRLAGVTPDEYDAAGAAAPGSTAAARHQKEPAPSEQQRRRPMATKQRRRQQQQAVAAEALHVPEPRTEQCNTAELEQGLCLFSQLLSFQKRLAGRLLAERLGPLDRWAAGGSGGRRRGGGHAPCPPSFSEIARRCGQGGYDSVDEMQAAVAAAAAHILAAAEEEQQRAVQEQWRGGHPPPPDHYRQQMPAAVATACAVQDRVDTACFWLRQQLHLREQQNVCRLAAAAAHVRQLQRKQQAEEEAAWQRAEEQQQAELERQEEGEEAEQSGDADGEHQEQEEHAKPAREAVWQPDADVEMEEAAARAVAGNEQEEYATPGAGAAELEAAVLPQEPHSGAADADAVKQLEQQRQFLAAAQLLRRHLCELLRPSVQQRLPPAPPQQASAWQALQEAAGRLNASAAAACGGVLASLEAVEGAEGAAGAGWLGEEAHPEALTCALAARCVAAFEAHEQAAAA